jgi:hypothetical protein
LPTRQIRRPEAQRDLPVRRLARLDLHDPAVQARLDRFTEGADSSTSGRVADQSQRGTECGDKRRSRVAPTALRQRRHPDPVMALDQDEQFAATEFGGQDGRRSRLRSHGCAVSRPRRDPEKVGFRNPLRRRSGSRRPHSWDIFGTRTNSRDAADAQNVLGTSSSQSPPPDSNRKPFHYK